MPTFSPQGGVDETEPTLIADDSLQDVTGAEYRVGEPGLFVARGRDAVATIASATLKGLYESGFDGVSQYVIAHEGNTLHAAFITATGLSFSLVNTVGADSLPLVGTHYANRHYLATGVSNMRMEGNTAQGVTFFPIGMSTAGKTVTVTVSAFSGVFSATTGFEYWVTEYDSVRGIESIFGATSNSGAFTNKAGQSLIIQGTQSNPNADKWRLYKSLDGGGYPDGGLLIEQAIGTTQVSGQYASSGVLTVPQYGIISIGGLDTDRDARPPVLAVIFGPFEDSLLGAAVSEPRVLRFTPAGYPDSWPPAYGIPLETHRRDEIVTGVVLPGRIGVFCKDSVHVVHRLPRDSDSIFGAGEAQEVLTDARGCMSRRGATVFTPPGSAGLAAWVARDGIWASNLVSSPFPLTDKTAWETRVSVANLSGCRLVDDATNRRLIFIYRRATDTTHNTGVWYLDYQHFAERGIRITFADHGPLADAVTIAAADGVRRVLSCDSRSGNGRVYLESTQDVDDSLLVNASGAVAFSMRSKEFMPAGPRGSVSLGKATWMHDAGPASIEHRFYFNRRDDNPEVKPMPDPDTRNASDVSLQRSVNSVSVGIASTGVVSYGVHWIDIEVLDAGPSGGRKGA